VRRTRIFPVLLGSLVVLTAGCLTAPSSPAPVAGATDDLRVPPMFKGAAPSFKLAQAADPGIQLWGAHIKLNAAPTAPQITQGFRLRRYLGWPNTPEQVLSNTPYIDRVISGYPLEMNNYSPWTPLSGLYMFGDASMYWDVASQSSPSIKSLAVDGCCPSTPTGQRYTGYMHIPVDGDYSFAWTDSYGHFYNRTDYLGSLAHTERLLTYFRIGSTVFKEADVEHTGYLNMLTVNKTPVRLKAGLYPYDYIQHHTWPHFAPAVVYKETPTATTWKRFPTSAWQVAVDGTNPTINVGGAAEPSFSGIGAADFSSVSYTNSSTYEAGFDARWQGRMARVTYTVPNGRYLVVQSVTARDLVNNAPRRASLTPFVQLDNLSVSAPLDQNGLQGVKLFGPGSVVSLAAPVLASATADEYVPEILVSGLLLSEEAFNKGASWVTGSK
jgi:hypothetical protein